jgi:hypothetical protein
MKACCFLCVVLAWACTLNAGPAIAANETEPDLDETEADCSVSVNGSGETDIEPGWPVVVEAVLILPDTGESMSPRIRITSASGAAQDWPLKAVESPAGLPSDERVLLWVLEPQSTARLAPGEYSVTISLMNGEKLSGECAPAVVRVSPVAAGKVGDDERFGIRLRYEAARGNLDEAAKIAAQWLEKQPQSIEAMIALGDLAAESGDLAKALGFYQRALDHWRPPEESTIEPPLGLLARRSAIQREMLKAVADPATAPGREE